MQSTYNGLELPKNGQPIDYKDGQFSVPDNPIIPFIEGDGTGRDIWKASQRVFDAAVEKAYGGKRAIRWFEIFAGEKAFRQFSNWLPDDSVAAARDSARLHQGTADHARRRRHPFAERGAAPDSRSLRLRAAGEVLPGRAQPGEASGKGGHRDLPREHGRRVRGHRVQAGLGGRGAADVFSERRSAAKAKKRVRADSGVGIKPISIFGTKRLVRARHPARAGDRPQDRDAGAQGQHPEVYRGRVSRVGLRGCGARSSAIRP